MQARYDVKREELRSKETEQKNLYVSSWFLVSLWTPTLRTYLECRISLQNARFRKLIGTDAKAETMEREVSRMHS